MKFSCKDAKALYTFSSPCSNRHCKSEGVQILLKAVKRPFSFRRIAYSINVVCKVLFSFECIVHFSTCSMQLCHCSY